MSWSGSKVKCDLCGYVYYSVKEDSKETDKIQCPNCYNISYHDTIINVT